MRLRYRQLVALLLSLSLILGFPAYVRAAEVVTASCTPGATINSIDSPTAGVTTNVTVKQPNFYTPVDFSNGTAAGQVTVKYAVTLSLVASTPQTIDLTSLTGGVGSGTATFSKIKIQGFYSNDTANTGKDIIISGGASNPYLGPLAGTTPTYTLKAGCAWLHFDRSTAGLTVDGTHKTIKLDPGGNNCVLTVVLAGN